MMRTCPECGRKISTHADGCPRCGAPADVLEEGWLVEDLSSCMSSCLVSGCLLFLLFLLAGSGVLGSLLALLSV